MDWSDSWVRNPISEGGNIWFIEHHHHFCLLCFLSRSSSTKLLKLSAMNLLVCPGCLTVRESLTAITVKLTHEVGIKFSASLCRQQPSVQSKGCVFATCTQPLQTSSLSRFLLNLRTGQLALTWELTLTFFFTGLIHYFTLKLNECNLRIQIFFYLFFYASFENILWHLKMVIYFVFIIFFFILI